MQVVSCAAAGKHVSKAIDEGVGLADRFGLKPIISAGASGEAIDLIAHPITFSAAAPRYDLAPPKLGQHNREIRAWLEETR